MHARNLFHVSAAMYDAWAVYDDTAVGYVHREKQVVANPEAARHMAISYAAHRVLSYRYGAHPHPDTPAYAQTTSHGMDPVPHLSFLF